jgi:hypothetical protein
MDPSMKPAPERERSQQSSPLPFELSKRPGVFGDQPATANPNLFLGSWGLQGGVSSVSSTTSPWAIALRLQ